MFKLTLGCGALFLYGSLGVASLGDDVRQGAPLSPESSPWALQDAERMISEDERERRVQVCERAFEDCRDWCTRTKAGQPCYKECSKKLGECMKDIPYADKD